MSALDRPQVPMWLLALVTLSSTLAIHIFAPALPAAGRDLGADDTTMRLTISIYIFGIAIGQLWYGPLADAFGRRRMLLIGLLLYGVGSLAAALAPDVNFLIGARLAQAFGGCAGLALGRTIVRDLAGPQDAARRLASLNMLMMIGPGLAPIVGALIVAAAGWRSIFLLLTAFAFTASLLTWRLMPETNATLGQIDVPAVMRGYLALFRSRRFVAISICGGCVTTSMFAFIASAPFIFSAMGSTENETGLYIGLLIAGVSLAAVTTRRLLLRFALRSLLLAGACCCLIAALGLIALVTTGQAGVASTVALMFLFAFGAGLSSPIALTLAISVNPQVIGSAAGVYGCVQMAVGALCAFLAGFGESPTFSTALVLAGAALVAQLCYRIAFFGEATAPDQA